MILLGLLNIVYLLLDGLLFLDLPSFPPELMDGLDAIYDLISGGMSLLVSILGSGTVHYLGILFQLVVGLHVALILWDIVWFFVRKIPIVKVDQ